MPWMNVRVSPTFVHLVVHLSLLKLAVRFAQQVQKLFMQRAVCVCDKLRMAKGLKCSLASKL